MRAVYRFLISLNTLFVVFTICAVLALVGSLTLPANLAFFSGIDDTPLFKWLSDAGNLKATWWIFVFIVVLALLATSMALCIVEDLRTGVSRKNILQKLSPQLIHLGTLFVLLGYLLTSAYGLRADVLIGKGETGAIGTNASLHLVDLNARTDENGYFTDWKAVLRFVKDGVESDTMVLRPVHPVRVGGYELFFKSIDMGDEQAALIRVCRDPGAGWALLGGALLLLGSLGLAYIRLRA